MFKMLMEVCLVDIFWTNEPYVTKLGMVMHYSMAVHHHEMECHMERLLCCANFKVKVTVKVYISRI